MINFVPLSSTHHITLWVTSVTYITITLLDGQTNSYLQRIEGRGEDWKGGRDGGLWDQVFAKAFIWPSQNWAPNCRTHETLNYRILWYEGYIIMIWTLAKKLHIIPHIPPPPIPVAFPFLQHYWLKCNQTLIQLNSGREETRVGLRECIKGEGSRGLAVFGEIVEWGLPWK